MTRTIQNFGLILGLVACGSSSGGSTTPAASSNGDGSGSSCVEARTLITDDAAKQFLGALDGPPTGVACDSHGFSAAHWKATVPPQEPGGISGAKQLDIDAMPQDDGSYQQGISAYKQVNDKAQYPDVSDVGGEAFGFINGRQEAIYLRVNGVRIYVIYTQTDATTPPAALPPFDGLKALAKTIVK